MRSSSSTSRGAAAAGPTLYHYKPLTQKFIGDRWSRIAHLPTFGEAAEALGSGASAFLRVNGADGASPEPALQAMLERLWEDMTDFSFPEDRFERVYAEVERNLFEKSRPATVLVAVHGIQMQKERVEMGDGLMLVRGDRTDAPDEAVWGDDAPGSPAALLVLTREVAPEDPVPLQEARDALPPHAHLPAPVEGRRDRPGRSGLAAHRRGTLAAVRARGHRRRAR